MKANKPVLLSAIALFVLAALFGACSSGGGGSPAPAPQTSVTLPKTGQTASYDANTLLRDDGALQKGVAWPEPRFTDNGDGTVTDNLTGLMWLKDANCIDSDYESFDNDGTAGDGAVTWQHALDFIAGINDGTYANCGAGYTDWRLPNRKELRSLINYGQANIAIWLFAQGFIPILSDNYWSSTSYAGDTNLAWTISLDTGYMTPDDKAAAFFYVWPVRDAAITSTISLPRTGQQTSYAAGDDGDNEAGVAWPGTRFTINADTTVTDNLTGLVWAPDALTPTFGTCTGGAHGWQGSLNYVACLNTNSYLGYNDWRLPNVNELESLVHAGYNEMICVAPDSYCASNAAWLSTQGFSVPVNYISYWSSTSFAGGTDNGAWIVDIGGGKVNGNFKTAANYVWPVRSGQSAGACTMTGTLTADSTSVSTYTIYFDTDGNLGNGYVMKYDGMSPDPATAHYEIDVSAIAPGQYYMTVTVPGWVTYLNPVQVNCGAVVDATVGS